MMKISLILLTLLNIPVLGISQNYIPIDFSLGTYWISNHTNCCQNLGAPACISSKYSEVVKDTLISPYTYSIIKMGYIENNGSSNCQSSSFIRTFFYRQDTLSKKIYERLPNGLEQIVFDFTQNVGDTCNFSQLSTANQFLVTSIDSISINGLFHKKINYGNNQFSLIEGIGSSLGITDIDFDFENQSILSCKSSGGFVQYPDTTINTINCLPTNNLGIQPGRENTYTLQIWPNPTSSRLKVHFSTESQYSIEVYNNIGQLLLTTTFKGNEIDIDMSHFTTGIYLLQAKNQDNHIHREAFENR